MTERGHWYQGFSSSGAITTVGSELAVRPTPPTSYSVPSGTSVTTSVGLASALAASTPDTIIVADGIYTHSGPVTVGAAHQVYAANLGGAEIQYGLVGGQFANTSGLRLQGLSFNVSDYANCFSSGHGGILVAWASGSNSWQILDCDLTGTDSITNAVSIQSSACYEGLIIRRCRAYNFHSNGFRIDSDSTGYVPSTPPILEDIYTENCVYQTYAQNSNGTAEAGLWLGCKATLNRLWCHQEKDYAVDGGRATQKAWQGLWLGTAARDMTINDLLVTGFIGYGVYGYGPLNADDTSTITVSHLETHYPVNVGFHLEWNNPSASHHPNNQNVVVQDSYIESQCVGWNADDGTVHSTVRNTVFTGQQGYCINTYQPGTGMLYDLSGNDYSGRLVGAGTIGTGHSPGYSCWGHDGGPGES